MKPSGREVGRDLRINPKLLENARAVATDGATVVRAPALTAALLTDLFEERICAIHIPGYASRALATSAARRIRKGSNVTQWYVPQSDNSVVKTDMAYGIGHPLYQELRESYFANAVPWTQKIRQAFTPHLSPVDRLRLELDELWAPGATIPRNAKGQSYFAGLVRIMNQETLLEGVARTQGSIHIDDSKRPLLPKVFSANCYIAVPRSGGALRIWNVALNKRAKTHPLFNLISRYAFHHGAQEAITQALPKPMTIRPRPGDLVIFDSARPHAVTGVTKGDRINIQTFLWYSGPKQSLHIHS